MFRRLRKKGITEEVAKKRTRRAVKMQKVFVGATADQIKAKRNQSSEVRKQVREKAIKEAKEKKQEQQTKKRAEKAKVAASRGAAAGTKAKVPKGSVKGKQGKR